MTVCGTYGGSDKKMIFISYISEFIEFIRDFTFRLIKNCALTSDKQWSDARARTAGYETSFSPAILGG
jgi:hypothetical protein